MTKPLPTHIEDSLYGERPHAKRVHVYPLNDLIEHDTSGKWCICAPKVEYPVTGGCLITHNQLQGAENYERDHDLSEDCWCNPIVDHVA